MATYKIPDNVRAKVERLYEGKAKDAAIEALEGGKILHVGPHKLKAIKQASKGQAAAKTAAPAAASSGTAKGSKDKEKEK